jgi:hypothetical protein
MFVGSMKVPGGVPRGSGLYLGYFTQGIFIDLINYQYNLQVFKANCCVIFITLPIHCRAKAATLDFTN